MTFDEWLRATYLQDPDSDGVIYDANDMREAFESGRDAERDYLAKGGSFK